MVRTINKIKMSQKKEKGFRSKQCNQCYSKVDARAIRCPCCLSTLEPEISISIPTPPESPLTVSSPETPTFDHIPSQPLDISDLDSK
jgi:hypothetical protein